MVRSWFFYIILFLHFCFPWLPNLEKLLVQRTIAKYNGRGSFCSWGWYTSHQKNVIIHMYFLKYIVLLLLGNIQSVIIWAFTALHRKHLQETVLLSTLCKVLIQSHLIGNMSSSFATGITGFKTNAIWQAHLIWHSFSELDP